MATEPANLPTLREIHEGQLRIGTPEQIELVFPLAGLGSRFLAAVADIMLQVAFNFVLIIVLVLIGAGLSSHLQGLSETAQKWFVALIIFIYFLLYWGYFSLFEAFWNGQTPGKRLMKIRVIKSSGRQITFFEALARNLLRVVDALPGAYLVGAVSVVLTRRNQRLGDLVADTIVVHEREDDAVSYTPPSRGRTFTAGLYASATPEAAPISAFPSDAVGKLSDADLNLMEGFLARAYTFDMPARAALASRMLDRLCATMAVPVPTEVPPERTLEALAYSMRSLGRR